MVEAPSLDWRIGLSMLESHLSDTENNTEHGNTENAFTVLPFIVGQFVPGIGRFLVCFLHGSARWR